MKSDKKLTTTELVTMALIACRDALQSQARALSSSNIPGVAQAIDEIRQSVDGLDFATAALASEVKFPIYAGGGGAMSPEAAAKLATWITRGKKDPFDVPAATPATEPPEAKSNRLGAALGKPRAE
jgi:hypothetical protein